MHSTAIDRRTFLALSGSAALAPICALAAPADEALFIGARLSGGRFEAVVIDAAGRDRLVLPLEARGHSFAIDAPRRRGVAFARSPGRFAIAFSFERAFEPIAFTAPGDRHFFGHGVFTPDGRLLLATENAFDEGAGRTGLYDVTAGFVRIGEFATKGIGPHELVLMGDGQTLCVANGGILTHPDFPRQKLNLADMRPSLAYLDARTGEAVEEAMLPPELSRLSLRHLATDAHGHVWFGAQYEGDPADMPPLVGRHRRGREIELFPGPEPVLRSMRNYVGSLAIDRDGEVLATSSPHGGVVVFWDTATGRHLGTMPLADACGVAPAGPGRIRVSSGRGAIVDAVPAGPVRRVVDESAAMPAWDNHLRRLR